MGNKRRAGTALLLVLGLAACGGGSAAPGGADTAVSDHDVVSDGAASTNGPDAGTSNRATITGHLYYSFKDQVFRIAATEGAKAENVSTALQKLSPGTQDRRINASTDGSFIVVDTDRFGCSGQCLAIVPRSLASGALVKPGGDEVSLEGIAAVSSDGELIVYPTRVGPKVQIFATRRQGSGWAAPTLLTGGSGYAYNNMPALSFDAKRVAFDCGTEPYPEAGGNDACEVKVDGTGFRKLVGPTTLAGARNKHVQNPHEGLDGVLFEASWPIGGDKPETIWLLPRAGGAPQPIAQKFPNAVSPCALSDGRFGMLWLGRAGNRTGAHELVVVARDGTIAVTLTPGLDVDDIGIGCSD